jgi:RNA polymerase sigma-70 factor, ECF subfamily
MAEHTAMTDRRTARLVAKAARGDGRAFAKLYDAFADRVYGFVRGRVRDERDAEELTETVFLKAWQALPGFEERGVPFAAWLLRIARNAIVDGHRRSTREPAWAAAEEADDLADEVRLDEEVFRRLDGERVRGALALLTEEQYSVVAMRFLMGLTLRDTAAAMDRTEGAVKALQHRALRTLARLLAEESDDASA